MATYSSDQLAALCWQLALLYQAGVPQEESVALLAQQSPPQLAAPLQQVGKQLGAGAPLSQALQGHFPHHMVHMLEIGEASGTTERVLRALSDYYRREGVTAAALRRAVVYPTLMALLIAVVFLVLVVQVLPVFAQVFDQMGLVLSPLVQGLLSLGTLSSWLVGGICVALTVGAAVLLVRLGRNQPLPLGRSTTLAVDRGRFASAMSLMLSAGMPLDVSLERTAQLLEGSPLGQRVTQCQKDTLEGVPFAQAVAKSQLLDGLEASLLSVGVRGGSADDAMVQVAVRCRDQSETALEGHISRLEFFLILVLCLTVGLVLLSVMLPLVGALAAIS